MPSSSLGLVRRGMVDIRKESAVCWLAGPEGFGGRLGDKFHNIFILHQANNPSDELVDKVLVSRRDDLLQLGLFSPDPGPTSPLHGVSKKSGMVLKERDADKMVQLLTEGLAPVSVGDGRFAVMILELLFWIDCDSQAFQDVEWCVIESSVEAFPQGDLLNRGGFKDGLVL